MTRRGRAILDDLVELPWRVSAVLCVVFLVADCLTRAETPLRLAFFTGTLAFGLAAALSFVRSWHQDRLLAKQSSLASLAALSWGGFEEMLAAAFRRQGYDATVTGDGGADGGVDLVLRRNGEVTLVQAKHWKGGVGVKIVRELNGVRDHDKAARGIVVTTAGFTAEARAFAARLPIELLGGEGLLKLIASGRDGVPMKANQKERPCPTCNSPMVLRVARKGPNPGAQFFGCSRYPACHATLPVGS